MNSPAESVDQVVKLRRTRKVVAKDGPVQLSHLDTEKLDQIVKRSIATAGLAPFHYDRGFEDIAEPWRFHVLWHRECRILANHLPNWFELRPNNKLPAMLNACGALVLANWLPQFDGSVTEEKKRLINEEHLAATASAIQNLLLLLTANGLGNYWSSGGFFRTDQMFEKLGIDQSQRLLGAIFVDYGAVETEVQIISGKQHENRAEWSRWTNMVEVAE